MIDLARYQLLRSRLDKAQREVDRAQGSLDQLMVRLKDEHGCETLKQAEKKLKRMESDSEGAEQEYDRLLSEFDEEWGDRM